MRKYLLNIISFFAIVTIIDICFGKIMDYQYFRAKGGETREMNDVCLYNDYDIIIMGSSRAHHHYVPEIIADSLRKNCFNAGIDGNGIITMYGIYQMVLERYKPELIIYDIAKGYDIYENPEDQNNSRYISSLKPYARISQNDEIFKSLSWQEWIKTYSSLYRYNSILFTTINNFWFDNSYNIDGYMKLETVMNYEPTIFESEDSGVLDSLKINYFEKFIRSTKDNGIPLVCVLSPRYRSVTVERYKPLFTLCEQYDIPLLNFYIDTTFSAHKEYFKDATHMNDRGARFFTSKLVEQIKNIR